MSDIRPLSFASVAVLTLALSQTALAADTTPAVAPAPTAPAANATQTAPAPTDAAQAQADAAQAAALAERRQHYDALRANAAEIGVELPETPPWEMGRVARPDWSERMRARSPEERQAMREARWQQMRTEAAEHGIEMSETPPWVEADKRRQEMAERFTQYRKTIEQMSEEQREAAQALFGAPPPRMAYPSFPRYDDTNQGWHPPCNHEPRGMPYPYPPMMPNANAPDAGRAMPASSGMQD